MYNLIFIRDVIRSRSTIGHATSINIDHIMTDLEATLANIMQ